MGVCEAELAECSVAMSKFEVYSAVGRDLRQLCNSMAPRTVEHGRMRFKLAAIFVDAVRERSVCFSCAGVLKHSWVIQPGARHVAGRVIGIRGVGRCAVRLELTGKRSQPLQMLACEATVSPTARDEAMRSGATDGASNSRAEAMEGPRTQAHRHTGMHVQL